MKIYLVAIAMVKSVVALSPKVQRHDPDLARQMRRACTSVPLNMAEGWHGHAGNRIARFTTAMTEARETTASLDVSVAVGYLSESEVAADLDRLDHIVACPLETLQDALVTGNCRLRGSACLAAGVRFSGIACATASRVRR